MTNLKLGGGYYKYMVADVTGFERFDFVSPVQHTAIPLYIGLGPEVPVGTFTHLDRNFKVVSVLAADDRLNPFPVPVVMAKRAK